MKHVSDGINLLYISYGYKSNKWKQQSMVIEAEGKGNKTCKNKIISIKIKW